MSMESVMPSNHLILCCPLLFLPSIFPSIRVFSNESVLHIRWPKYLSFSFSISPSNGYSELISFRIDWLAFALLHFVLQGQACLLLQESLDFLLLYSTPLWWKAHLFLVLVLEGPVGLHGTIQLQLLQHYWLGHRLGLLWYWIVCLGNEQRAFCRFWDCTQVLHFRLFWWQWGLLHFF